MNKNQKIKEPNITINTEPTKRNLRILFLADLMAVISGFLLSAIIRSDLTMPVIFYNKDLYYILGLSVIVKLIAFSTFGMFNGM